MSKPLFYATGSHPPKRTVRDDKNQLPLGETRHGWRNALPKLSSDNSGKLMFLHTTYECQGRWLDNLCTGEEEDLCKHLFLPHI